VPQFDDPHSHSADARIVIEELTASPSPNRRPSHSAHSRVTRDLMPAEDDDDLLHRVPPTSHLEPPFGLSRVEDMAFEMDGLPESLMQATCPRATT
jgi:hypothetical protein